MHEKINEEVGVVMYYSARQRAAVPHLISWQNREYAVGKIGYHHTVREGQTLHHIFELVVDHSPCLKAGDSWAEHSGPDRLTTG